MLDKIKSSCKFVQENSKYVKINKEKVDEYVEKFKEPKFWLMTNPFNILDLSVEDLINFLLIYHTIGDYCFWGNPKWEIKRNEKVLDGSFAIMLVVLERFKKNKDFNVSWVEFQELLKGNGDLPLIKERFEELEEMNKFLKGQSFYTMIKDFTTDEDLFNYLVTNLTYFKDERLYKGKTIYFYKRAQLLTSDILHIRKILEGLNVDYSHLVGCADYKIPQVMNCLGMLEYSEYLDKKLENMQEIEVNSEEEIEIRASALMVIDYIYERLGKSVCRMDINDMLWMLGQDKTKINKKYHRTKTVNY